MIAKKKYSKELVLTKKYYEENAEKYFKETVGVDMSSLYLRFLEFIPPQGLILDAGTGSGRDAQVFKKLGYQVYPIDLSPAMCKISSQYLGSAVINMSFEDLDIRDKFDGVWANASLVHTPVYGLHVACQKLINSLKHGGVLYISFKYGEGERVARDGRFFTDMNEKSLEKLVANLENIKMIDMWTTAGEGRFYGSGDWLNAILMKSSRGNES